MSAGTSEAGVEVGSVDDVPVGEGRAFSVGAAQIAVFRLPDGSLRALDAVCPHRGGPLADGLIDEQVVVCPLHNHAFSFADGDEAGGADLCVRTYPVTVVDGSIRLTV